MNKSPETIVMSGDPQRAAIDPNVTKVFNLVEKGRIARDNLPIRIIGWSRDDPYIILALIQPLR